MLIKHRSGSKSYTTAKQSLQGLRAPRAHLPCPLSLPLGAGLLSVLVFDFALWELWGCAYSEPSNLSQIGLKGIFVPQINLQREKWLLKAAKLGEIFILFYYFGWGKGTVFPWQGQILTGKTLQRLGPSMRKTSCLTSCLSLLRVTPKVAGPCGGILIMVAVLKSHFCLLGETLPQSRRVWEKPPAWAWVFAHTGVCPQVLPWGRIPFQTLTGFMPALGGETVTS